MKNSRLIILTGFLALVLLPVAGFLVRSSREPGCALDGMVVDPTCRVRIQEGDKNYEFCCVRCAELWLKRQPKRPRDIFVTDEPSGQEIPALTAYFVRNQVVTMPVTGNRVHAFKDPLEADKYANDPVSRGTVLEKSDRPFAQE